MTHSTSQPGQHLLGGTLRVFLAEALLPLTGILTAAFLSRHLGPTGYGLLSLTVTMVTWFEWVIASFFSRATIKFVSEAEDWRPVGAAVTRLYVVIGGSTAVLLWSLAPLLARLFHEPSLVSYIRLFAFEVPLFSLAQAHRNILTGMGNFGQIALASAGRWITRLLLIVTLVQCGFSVPGAILGILGSSFVELTINRYAVRPSLFGGSAFSTRQLWPYAIPLFLSALSLSCYSRLDLLILKALGATAAQAGVYSAAQNLSLFPGLFALSLSPLLLSTLGRVLAAGDIALAQEIGRNAMRVVIGLLPFIVMVAGTADDIVQLIFGAAFLPAAPLFALLLLGALALVMVSVGTAIVTAAGQPLWTFVLTGPFVPLAAVGHCILIPWLGALGAALVTSGCAILSAIGAVLAVYRLWGVLPPSGTCWRSILVSSIAYGLAVLWPASRSLVFCKLAVISMVCLLAFWLLGEFNRKEIALTRSLLGWSPQPRQA